MLFSGPCGLTKSVLQKGWFSGLRVMLGVDGCVCFYFVCLLACLLLVIAIVHFFGWGCYYIAKMYKIATMDAARALLNEASIAFHRL